MPDGRIDRAALYPLLSNQINIVARTRGKEEFASKKKYWDAESKSFILPPINSSPPGYWSFIPGPLDIQTLTLVTKMGKRAVCFWLLLHCAERLASAKKRSWFGIPGRELRRFRIDSACKSRIVSSLEMAGLIKVLRQRNKATQFQFPSKSRD